MLYNSFFLHFVSVLMVKCNDQLVSVIQVDYSRCNSAMVAIVNPDRYIDM